MQSESYLNNTCSSLSSRLKDETADVHEAAERSIFMTRLLEGELGIDAYVRLLHQYLAVYRTLETASVGLRGDPIAGPFARFELARREALERDLAVLAGQDWAAGAEITSATAEYVAAIDGAVRWSGGFVAHQYVRYLGDLSGGQIIRRILARVFDLDEDRGLAFYVFDQFDNGVQFKKRYRQQLDDATWDEEQTDRIVAEARRAFQLNLAMFESLLEPQAAPVT